MSFPEGYISTEPLPWGMVHVKKVEMPSVLDRYFGAYRYRPAPEPKHIRDDA